MADLYQRSIEIILANQSPSGAYVASPNFPTYHYCWFRDGSLTAYAMDLVGQHQSAARFHAWAARAVNCRAEVIWRAISKVAAGDSPDNPGWVRHEPSGAPRGPAGVLRDPAGVLREDDILHTRLTLEGEDGTQEEWTNFQLDGFGTWLWALEQHHRLTNEPLPPDWLEAAGRVVDYLLALWRQPCFDLWEEFGDKVHPYTLSAIYGGLSAYIKFTAEDAHLPWRAVPGENAEVFKYSAAQPPTAPIKKGASHRGDAEFAEFSLNKRASASSAFSAVISCLAEIRAYIEEHFVYDGHFVKFEGRPEVDACLLGLAMPYGVVPPDDPRLRATVAEIERTLRGGSAAGVHRYAADTYYGGGEWILLAAWLGWYYAVAAAAPEAVGWASSPDPSGKDAQPTMLTGRIAEILAWIEAQAGPDGGLPEQVPANLNDPAYYPHWLAKWGPIANPLLWSHAEYIILRNFGKL